MARAVRRTRADRLGDRIGGDCQDDEIGHLRQVVNPGASLARLAHFSASGLTTQTLPGKPKRTRCCTVSPPRSPARPDAPITAIDFGYNRPETLMKSAIIHDGDHVRMTLASCSYFLSLRVANDTRVKPEGLRGNLRRSA